MGSERIAKTPWRLARLFHLSPSECKTAQAKQSAPLHPLSTRKPASQQGSGAISEVGGE